MAPRSTGSATIWFGKLPVPVKVYPATMEPPKISFNQLHKKDGARVKQQLVCSADAIVLATDDIVKGFEVSKDRYVTFTPDELKALEETPNPAIEIDVFVPLSAIEPVFFAKPYYLGPDKGSEDRYALLADVLRLSNRAALAMWKTRGQDLFVCLRHSEGRMVLQQLLRADEVRDIGEIDAPPAPPAEANLQLGLKVADARGAEEFRPEDYPDEIYARKLALIQQKVEGKEIIASPVEGKAQIVDLFAALQASVKGRPTKKVLTPGRKRR